ncbi:MAG: hypothetical protein AB7E70_20355 [Hyphomicrobiaceae bacterium]
MSLNRILLAIASVVGFAQSGILVLPVHDETKALAAFVLGALAVFLGTLLKGEATSEEPPAEL